MVPGARAPGGGGRAFAPGEINTDGDEYGPTFTSDGQTLFFVTRQTREQAETIVYSTLAGGHWSPPQPTSFSGKSYDKEPFLSPDGSQLFFASRRAGPQGGTSFDLWTVDRKGTTWGEPRHLGPGVNTDGYENYPAVAANGALYFARRGQKTGNDLYRAPKVGNGYPQAEPLAALNTDQTDADPFIAPDESYIIFSSDRPGGLERAISTSASIAAAAGPRPTSLGPKVNSATYEYTPLVSPDRRYLYFSRGWGEIWRIALSELDLQAPR